MASAFVELSDEEVQILVDLMTKEDTCDVAKLNLEAIINSLIPTVTTNKKRDTPKGVSLYKKLVIS